MASTDPHENSTTGCFDTFREPTEPPEPKPSASQSQYELTSVVVEYDGRPDRCTIYSADADRLERMASWITTDADTFVSLDEMH
ncbi:DUF7511 domain-containing protein [Haladaptatus sp. NG-SE-30]